MHFQLFSTIIVVLVHPHFPQVLSTVQGPLVGEACLREIADGLTSEECIILVTYLSKETQMNLTVASDILELDLRCIYALQKLVDFCANQTENVTWKVLENGLASINKINLTACLKKEFPDFASDDETDTDDKEPDYLNWFPEDNFLKDGLIVVALFLFAVIVIACLSYKASKEFIESKGAQDPLIPTCAYSQEWYKFSGSESGSEEEERPTEERKLICPVSHKYK
ncbi:unnamed protein product [Allacma fusca]|uniref:Uncharacterized protein n=1 Tax=Allacma fusca TaxID=39272 RepID=A0A8J2P6S8_9HEXA|nr:unnamed protein product [Allacma fusca]